MLFNYPIASTSGNWIHDCISEAFKNICRLADAREDEPVWPDILREEYRDALREKETLPKRLKAFSDEIKKISAVERQDFLDFFSRQNQIRELLDNTIPIPSYSNVLEPVILAAKAVCSEGFALLTKTGARDVHYKIIWDALKNKTCPFCGFEPFDAPTLHREDEDHYLAKSLYPLAAANFLNLVPMGSKCNERYKGQIDILHLNGIRRKAINPYENEIADINLNQTILFDGPNGNPVWQVDLIPNNEKTRTWESVFSIRLRLVESILSPYYYTWLEALPDWFEIAKIDDRIGDDQLFATLDQLVSYMKKHKESGPGFLKDKVFEMITYHCKLGNPRLIKMVRSSLPKHNLVF